MYDCSKWTPLDSLYAKLSGYHRSLLLRCLDIYDKRAPANHVLSYRAALERAGCECVETTVKKQRLRFVGNVLRMGDGRQLEVIMSGELDEGAARGRGRPARQWPQCVVDEIKDFGIPITV